VTVLRVNMENSLAFFNEPHTQLGLVIIKKLRWTAMFLQSTVV